MKQYLKAISIYHPILQIGKRLIGHYFHTSSEVSAPFAIE